MNQRNNFYKLFFFVNRNTIGRLVICLTAGVRNQHNKQMLNTTFSVKFAGVRGPHLRLAEKGGSDIFSAVTDVGYPTTFHGVNLKYIDAFL